MNAPIKLEALRRAQTERVDNRHLDALEEEAIFILREVAGAFEPEQSLGGRCEVSGAANQPWHMLGNGIENLAGGIAAGGSGFFRFASFRVFNIAPWEGGDFLVPALRKIAIEHLLDVERLGGELGFVIREQFIPSLA